jgi:L-lactate dehydrogenase complex protein LldF
MASSLPPGDRHRAAHGVRKVIKSKSMLSEEADLNQALEAAGIQPVETDLGEYILQIAGNEPPSHIIAPVMHKNVDQVADLFARTHGTPRKTDIPALTREAREVLREHFVSAEMGISGANFLIAETGSAALVTNEGNGRMVTTLPKVHVVITGIEKIVPTLDDFATLMRLLPRSATGQVISNYVSLLTGNQRSSPAGEEAHDGDGPETMVLHPGRQRSRRPARHRVPVDAELHSLRRLPESLPGLSDGWRARLRLGLPGADGFGPDAALRRHRQSARPAAGVDTMPAVQRRLPGPDSFAGTVAPAAPAADARRPAPAQRTPRSATVGLAGAAAEALCAGGRIGARYLKWLAGDTNRIRLLPTAPEWSLGRDFPAPQGKTFRELYA